MIFGVEGLEALACGPWLRRWGWGIRIAVFAAVFHFASTAVKLGVYVGMILLQPFQTVRFEIGAVFAVFGGHPAGVAVEGLDWRCYGHHGRGRLMTVVVVVVLLRYAVGDGP